MKRIVNILITGLLLTLLAVPGHTKTSDDINFSDVYSFENVVMDLKGIGQKKIMFANIFVAGLYLHQDVTIEQAMDDVAKRVEITYFQNVAASRLAGYISKRMRKNMTSEEYEQVEPRIQKMHDYFIDLSVGDRFSMTYIPDIGTRFECNNQLLGTVEGADFGRGIFATWIGDKPFDKSVKKQVLGLK